MIFLRSAIAGLVAVPLVLMCAGLQPIAGTVLIGCAASGAGLLTQILLAGAHRRDRMRRNHRRLVRFSRIGPAKFAQ